jgi:large subunit ribosomal protein L35
MTDLDRPNLAEQSYDEWCHWMVSDITVKGRTTIEGGSSFDAPIKPANGMTVLEYIPPHPALSNPSKVHRYVVTLLKQSGPLNVEALIPKSGEGVMQTDRAHFLPLRKFAKTYGLTWVGFGFFSSVWNKETPAIFQSLGTFS